MKTKSSKKDLSLRLIEDLLKEVQSNKKFGLGYCNHMSLMADLERIEEAIKEEKGWYVDDNTDASLSK